MIDPGQHQQVLMHHLRGKRHWGIVVDGVADFRDLPNDVRRDHTGPDNRLRRGRWRFEAFAPFMAIWPIVLYAPVAHLVFSPVGCAEHLGLRRRHRLCRVTDGGEVAMLSGHTAKVTNCIYSPDGRLFTTSSDDGTPRLWQSRCLPAPNGWY
jgi:WD40 repeat protein